MMIDTLMRSLHNRPHALNAVGIHIIGDIVPPAVANKTMPVVPLQPIVPARLVSVDRSTRLNRPSHHSRHRRNVTTRTYRKSKNRPLTLPEPYHRLLAYWAPARLDFLVRMLVALDPTYVGLIHLHNPRKLRPLHPHRLTQPMQQEPSRLLRDPKMPRQSIAADALPRRDEEIHRIQPLVKRKVCVGKNTVSPHRKLPVAVQTPMPQPTRYPTRAPKTAKRTHYAVRPTLPLKETQRRSVIRAFNHESHNALIGADPTTIRSEQPANSLLATKIDRTVTYSLTAGASIDTLTRKSHFNSSLIGV